jgi:DNA polymerase III subunit delta'
MPLDELTGYETQIRLFRRILSRKAFHSSYLFYGPLGVGKRKLAKAFASAIFCTELENDFCGRCSACRRMASGHYPDFRLIEPDGAYIKIEQTRHVIGEAATKPLEGPKKIFVLDPLERMRAEAANSLLKVLEEPFDFSLFILITSSPRAILPTIDSRCQKIRFSPLPFETVAQHLEERLQMASEKANTLARLSGGRPELAEQLAEGDFLTQRDEILKIITKIGRDKELAAARASDRFRSNRDEAERFLHLLLPLLRDAACLRENPDSPVLLNQDRKKEITEVLQYFELDQLMSAWKSATEAVWNIRQNANVQAQLDHVLFQLCQSGETVR